MRKSDDIGEERALYIYNDFGVILDPLTNTDPLFCTP